jgi:hypothetical protein
MTTQSPFPTITPIHHRLRPWLKASVVATTALIHEMKGKRKRPQGLAKDASWSGHVPGLDGLRWDARALNIAYGLVRGRAYKQIEPKIGKGDFHSEEACIAHVADAVARLLSTQTKLYVAINPHLNMTAEQKMVQGAHAVAEFMVDNTPSPWLNGTLVFIDMPSLFGTASGDHEGSLTAHEAADPTGRWSYFCEPDLGGKVTAVAIWSPNGERELRLDRAPRLQIQPITNFAGPRSEMDARFGAR